VHFRVIAVGKPHDRAVGEAIASYEQRAARYWPLEIAEVRGGGAGQNAKVARAKEGERLLARVTQSFVVALHEAGKSMTSIRFAAWLQEKREAASDVSLVIGGAHGLDDAVLIRADLRLSVAPWTLPHELARLVLAEQLYRAGTIVRREPYHKQDP
jgi:23S rRNA (pseudouridine1915-N3)-methyltransferase